MSDNKRYLGDSVYVDCDGYGFKLTTENGYPDDPRNQIYLEFPVYEALVQYVDALKKHHEENHAKTDETGPRSV